MNRIKSDGLICIKNKINIEFAVCKIEYILWEDETFKYIFTPYYDVISLLESNIFQGIPGLEIDLKKKEYIRENVIPTFIAERVPSEKREDYYELIQKVGMNYMNPVDYLIKTQGKYSGDNLYVKEFIERKNVVIHDVVKKSNTLGVIKIMLDNLAYGNKIVLNDRTIENSIDIFQTLTYIYQKGYDEIKEKQRLGRDEAKKMGNYRGRKAIEIDKLLFLEQVEQLDSKIITIDKVLKNLKISRATFYRLKKKYQK